MRNQGKSKAFSVALRLLRMLAADPNLDPVHRKELKRGIREFEQIDRKGNPAKVKLAIGRLAKMLWEITRKDR